MSTTAKKIRKQREERRRDVFKEIRSQAKHKNAKIYTRIEELFDDEIITATEIIIFWAKRGKGKSALSAWFEREFMKPSQARQSLHIARELCEELNQIGYNLHPPKDHTVFVDTSFNEKTFFGERSAYKFKSSRWGLPNEKFETDLIMPGGKYFFDEGQKGILDSHSGAPDVAVSACAELSRQIGLFLGISTQRPMRIHIDFRDLATFFEVLPVHGVKNAYGRTSGAWWEINIIYDSGKVEDYLKSKDEELIDKTIIIYSPASPWKWYDTKYFRYEFFKNSQDKQFVLEKCSTIQTPEELAQFMQELAEEPATTNKKQETTLQQRKRIKTMEEEIELLKKTIVKIGHYTEEQERKSKREEKKLE